MIEPDYDFWRAERSRLLDNQFPTPDTGRCLDAVDVILEMEAALLALRARVAKLEAALCKVSTAARKDTSLSPPDPLLAFIVGVVDAALKDAPQ